jgi:hypothetical protein
MRCVVSLCISFRRPTTRKISRQTGRILTKIDIGCLYKYVFPHSIVFYWKTKVTGHWQENLHLLARHFHYNCQVTHTILIGKKTFWAYAAAVKVRSLHKARRRMGVAEENFHSFLTLALDDDEWSSHPPSAILPGHTATDATSTDECLGKVTKAYGGSGRKFPLILNLGIRWRWVVISPTACYTAGAHSPRCHFNRRMFGPRAGLELHRKYKNLCLSGFEDKL